MSRASGDIPEGGADVPVGHLVGKKGLRRAGSAEVAAPAAKAETGYVPLVKADACPARLRDSQ